jgi:hypothetical protein
VQGFAKLHFARASITNTGDTTDFTRLINTLGWRKYRLKKLSLKDLSKESFERSFAQENFF